MNAAVSHSPRSLPAFLPSLTLTSRSHASPKHLRCHLFPSSFLPLPQTFSFTSSRYCHPLTCPPVHINPVSIRIAPTAHTPSRSVSSIKNPLTIASTIVGVLVLIGSLLYKLPQLFRVLSRRSAKGISPLMYTLETLGTTFSAVYYFRKSFPFSTYGETVFIMFQNLVLIALIVFFQKLPKIPALLLASLYLCLLISLLLPFTPLSLLMFLQLCSIPILNLARVPQILLNYRRKSTGELSPITLGLQLLGNLARIFTTVAQVGDPLMFAGNCIATMFNATLFLQWLSYSKVLTNTPKQIQNP